ncbi:MAG TPA: glycosyltransferase family 4 protein [Thermoplasmata archaeon]|nr:glycosyltransferase family 4 protein [Thermoplasmata archaeon]HUJ77406.1 glycosyltransferase family 4 protein [Thermoplasmata archaeon]
MVRLRILQVTPYYHPHAGGVESHVRAIATEFVREGHVVTVLTSRFDRRLPAEETIDGVRVVRAPTLAVAWNTPIDAGTRRLIRAIPADVIHLHYPPPLTAHFALRGLGPDRPPVVLTYHCDLYLAGPLGRLATGLYERLILPGTLRGVDRIIVHTRSYGQTSRALAGRPLEIVPSSVDLARFHPAPADPALRRALGLDGRRLLAFTGRLVPHKGLDALLRAVAQLPEDVALLLIGRGPGRGSLEASARRLGVLDRVRFLSEVGDDALADHLRLAELFVFPSQNRLEGFGLAVAEAMAVGLPVLIADMPGVREVIEPGTEGLLIEPMNPDDLAEKVRTLLGDPATRARMGAAARRRAEARYGVETVAGELIRRYQALRAAG